MSGNNKKGDFEKDNYIVKPSKFITSINTDLNVTQQQAMNGMLYFHKVHPELIDENDVVNVPFKEFTEFTGIGSASNYKPLRTKINQLIKCTFRSFNIEDDGTFVDIYKPVFSEIRVTGKRRKRTRVINNKEVIENCFHADFISFKFSSEILPDIEGLTQFAVLSAKINREHRGKSAGSMALWQLCSLHLSKSKRNYIVCEYDVEEQKTTESPLHMALGLAGKYPRYSVLERDVLRPAMKLVNEFNDSAAKKYPDQTIYLNVSFERYPAMYHGPVRKVIFKITRINKVGIKEIADSKEDDYSLVISRCEELGINDAPKLVARYKRELSEKHMHNMIDYCLDYSNTHTVKNMSSYIVACFKNDYRPQTGVMWLDTSSLGEEDMKQPIHVEKSKISEKQKPILTAKQIEEYTACLSTEQQTALEETFCKDTLSNSILRRIFKEKGLSDPIIHSLWKTYLSACVIEDA